jgi:hypothetical protein
MVPQDHWIEMPQGDSHHVTVKFLNGATIRCSERRCGPSLSAHVGYPTQQASDKAGDHWKTEARQKTI